MLYQMLMESSRSNQYLVVPVVVDNHGCNGNEDINFRFIGFTISGRVVGAVGGGSCSVKNGGRVAFLDFCTDVVFEFIGQSWVLLRGITGSTFLDGSPLYLFLLFPLGE
ncbi:hypothetical protein RIF29_20499 [Crotalaria pallida]|uniref:Uncharacterized protein n=1 Tax=Crotalaria pallida TaxID=3830 RepID=A0AAN9I8R1_CROPI